MLFSELAYLSIVKDPIVYCALVWFKSSPPHSTVPIEGESKVNSSMFMEFHIKVRPTYIQRVKNREGKTQIFFIWAGESGQMVLAIGQSKDVTDGSMCVRVKISVFKYMLYYSWINLQLKHFFVK